MKPFAWSYSALMCFEQCPKKYYHLYVIRDVKDTDSEYATDGKAVHQAMEARVIHGQPLPMPMRAYEKLARPFAESKGEKFGESRFALDRRFQPVDFFAPSVWVRAVVDLVIVRGEMAVVVDWKTGKVRNDFTQLGLNAAVLSRWMPEVTEFRTVFVWLKDGSVAPKTFKADDLPKVWNELLPRVSKIEEARKMTEFPAKPGPLCAWCPVATCPHYSPRVQSR